MRIYDTPASAGVFFCPPTDHLNAIASLANYIVHLPGLNFFCWVPHKWKNYCVIVSSNPKINLQTEKPNK